MRGAMCLTFDDAVEFILKASADREPAALYVGTGELAAFRREVPQTEDAPDFLGMRLEASAQ